MGVVVERGAVTDAGWPQVVCAGNLTAVNLFCKKACRSLRFFVHLSKNGFPKRRRASDHLNRPAVEKLICPPLCLTFVFFIHRYYVVYPLLFCGALVFITFCPNIFSTPVRCAQIIHDEQELGTVLFYPVLHHAGIFVFESLGLRHHAPDAPCFY